MNKITFLDLFTKANANTDLYTCAAHKKWKDRVLIYSYQYSFHHKTSPFLVGQIRPILEYPYHVMELKSTTTSIYPGFKSFIINQGKRISRIPEAYESLKKDEAVISTYSDLFIYCKEGYICIFGKLSNVMKHEDNKINFINYDPTDSAWILYDSLDEAIGLVSKNYIKKATKV